MARISLADVSHIIYQEWKCLHALTPTEEGFGDVDVRLVSNEDKTDWIVNFGDASYDQWHGAACGATSFNTSDKPTKKITMDMARDLVGQVEDALAS